MPFPCGGSSTRASPTRSCRPSGHAQAEHLARYLADERIDAIYASPLRRAHQTAEPLAAAQELTIVTEDGVAEYDRGASWYVPVEELKASNDPRWQEMLDGTWHASLEIDPFEFRDTLCTAIERIITAHPSQKVAIVCHGGVINAYLSRILDLDDPTGFFYPNYTSIHRVMAARSGERSILTSERDRAPPRHRPAGRDQRLTAAAWRRRVPACS